MMSSKTHTSNNDDDNNKNNKNKKNKKNKEDEDDEEGFDSILFRHTPGAPLSYDEDDAFSLMLASSDKPNNSNNKKGTKIDAMGFAIAPMTNRRSHHRQHPVLRTTVPPDGMISKLISISSDGAFSPIRPKVYVKLIVEEDVSSTQEMKSHLDDITSVMNIDGTALVQIKPAPSSSIKSIMKTTKTTTKTHLPPPLKLFIEDPDYPDEQDRFVYHPTNVTLLSNDKHKDKDKDDGNGNAARNGRKRVKNNAEISSSSNNGDGGTRILTVPEGTSVGEDIQLASWHRSVMKRFMPVLIQTKIFRTGPDNTKCMVAIQLRSNLKNKGSLHDLSIAIAIPPTVISSTLFIKENGSNGSDNKGSGSSTTKDKNKGAVYDNIKRIITCRAKELPVGSSYMFAFEIDVLSNLPMDELPKFPILLRCYSREDTVSSVEVTLEEWNKDHPVSLVVERVSSFRLLHRLPA